MTNTVYYATNGTAGSPLIVHPEADLSCKNLFISIGYSWSFKPGMILA